MSSSLAFFVFTAEIFSLYFLSRLVLQKAYISFRRIGLGNRMIIGIISVIYLPGTIIHELSHYFIALLLNANPHEVSIFPVIEEKKVRLGHVIYEKRKGEFIRPILIGVAPLFGALAVLWLIVYSRQFPGNEIWKTILFGYLILTITANMFSSQQDLVDVIYLVPLGILILLILYLFPISISASYLTQITNVVVFFVLTIQPPLLFSILFHAILVLVLSKLK
ncbi:MAG: hypothetical protein WA061_03015 [Microgenomates group bacterium]